MHGAWACGMLSRPLADFPPAPTPRGRVSMLAPGRRRPLPRLACPFLVSQADRLGALPGGVLFQGVEQEEDFGGHRVVQLRGVGKGAVAAAGDDGLERVEQDAQ